MRMLRIVLLTCCFALLASRVSRAARSAQPLDIYFVDVEGGQATLIVAPSGESMLIDTGWPDFGGRDAERIVAVATLAGLTRIDNVLITHHHTDHVGGVLQLAERFPIGAFIDHGPSVESGKNARDLAAAYKRAIEIEKARHRVMKPGDQIALRGVDIRVLTSNGEHIDTALAGAGEPNPYCKGEMRVTNDPTDNARSVGILLTFGQFRFIDLGDLTWNKELDLVCPNNRVGGVDVYLTTHHGLDASGPSAIVHALHPRVAIMNNGARKGGSPQAWQTVKSSAGLEDLWQLHYAVGGGKEHNVTEDFIANPDEQCEGKYIKLSVRSEGGFAVTNSRNGLTKQYPPRKLTAEVDATRSSRALSPRTVRSPMAATR